MDPHCQLQSELDWDASTTSMLAILRLGEFFWWWIDLTSDNHCLATIHTLSMFWVELTYQTYISTCLHKLLKTPSTPHTRSLQKLYLNTSWINQCNYKSYTIIHCFCKVSKMDREEMKRKQDSIHISDTSNSHNLETLSKLDSVFVDHIIISITSKWFEWSVYTYQ